MIVIYCYFVGKLQKYRISLALYLKMLKHCGDIIRKKWAGT